MSNQPINSSSSSTLIAGSICSSLVADTLLYSIESLKSIHQSHIPIQTSHIQLNLPSWPIKLRSLYFGVGTATVGSCLANVIYFSSYEFFKHNISGNWNCFLAGGLADLMCCFLVTVPLDTIKSNLQVYGPTEFKNGLDAMRKLTQRHNFSFLYRAFPWTVLRDVPYSAIQFGLFEYLVDKMTDKASRKKKFSKPISSFIAGGIAGGIAAFLTHPLDSIKTKIQLQNNFKLKVRHLTIREFDQLFRAGCLHRTLLCSLYSGLLLGVYHCIN